MNEQKLMTTLVLEFQEHKIPYHLQFQVWWQTKEMELIHSLTRCQQQVNYLRIFIYFSYLGKVSTQVYLASSTGCFVEYNGSSDFTGATLGSTTESDISRDYGTGVVYGGLFDNIR